MGHRRDAIEHERADERADGVEPLARESDAPHRPEDQPTADDADDESDTHLQCELAGDMTERAGAESPGGDQARHEGDADRVVRAGLAFQDGSGGFGHLALAEYGEDYGRVGRRDGRPDEQSDIPVEPEQQVRRDRRGGDGEERAEYTGEHDRCQRTPKPAQADVHPALEQDDRQRDGHDALDGALRWGVEVGYDGGGHRRGGHEECRGRQLDPLTEAVRQHRDEPDGGNHRHQGTERSDVVHSGAPLRAQREPVADQPSRHTDVEVRPSTMRHVTRGRDAVPGRLLWNDRLPLDPDVDATAFDRSHHARVVVLVFVGGRVGGVIRYAVARHWSPPPGGFPWATFAVNVLGAFLLGVVVELATEVLTGSRHLRPLIGTGFCGALTTFSAIVVDVDRMAAHGHAAVGAGYLAMAVVAGLAAGALGLFVTRALTR